MNVWRGGGGGSTSAQVVDLSADFRLTDPAVYEEWYGTPHKALELQAEAVYRSTPAEMGWNRCALDD